VNDQSTPATPADAADHAALKARLRAKRDGLAAAALARGGWEPACIARAFATPQLGDLAFTMQAWIDLSDARSPLLDGRRTQTPEEFAAAWLAFGLPAETLATRSGEEMLDIESVMLAEIAEGFSMVLPMRQPPRYLPDREESAPPSEPDGFGDWAPMMACLVTQLRLALAEARPLKVSAAHVLIAAHRRNDGWSLGGTPYALRGITKEGA
jgi:hypothetical protein